MSFINITIHTILRMGLYGIYGSHTTEACPLFNVENRKLILEIAEVLEKTASKNRVKILEQYHCGLEHTFIWIVDAENAHLVQDLMIETRVAKFNVLKIVPFGTFQKIVEVCKKLELSNHM
jgi:hypothetical protein